MLIQEAGRNIPSSTILDLIEVQPPYFALSDFYLDRDNWLVATIPVQSQSDYESCQIIASEVGRHLAILGSCYGAIENPSQSKHYYLAHKAKLITFPAYISQTQSTHLKGKAIAKFVSKRELTAFMKLYDLQGRVIATIDVDYHVLAEKSFERIYGTKTGRKDYSDHQPNPYKKPVDLEIISSSKSALVTSIGTIYPEQCVGHFDRVRALPVAILSQCFLNSCYEYLRRYLCASDARFVVKDCKLAANKLAMAGQRITIETEFMGTQGSIYTMRSIARDECNEIVGEMQSSIEQVHLHANETIISSDVPALEYS